MYNNNGSVNEKPTYKPCCNVSFHELGEIRKKKNCNVSFHELGEIHKKWKKS